jgi:two-component system, cell cycle response regulator DivK
MTDSTPFQGDIPVSASPPQPANNDDLNPTGEASAPRSRRAGVVLIVDDSRDARDIYAAYLNHRGFRTYTSPDGSAAIDMALEYRPDLVVMDLTMPYIDGITAIRRLKTHPPTKHIPVILLTGYPSKAIERGAIEAGADIFLTKPCLPEDLEGHIRELLKRSS